MSKASKSASVPPEETSLDGDLGAAKLRLLRFAGLAASELSAVQLNALSMTMSAYLMGKLGARGVYLCEQVVAELASEQARDLAIRLMDAGWERA